MARTRARTADPRLKLGVAAVALAVGLAAPRPASPLVLAVGAAAALLATAERERVPWPAMLGAWGLGAAAAALRALLTPGPPLLAAAVAGHAISLSAPGLSQALLVLSRVAASTLVAAWVTSTTPFSQLVAALGWARVPIPMLDLLLLAHRHRHAMRESLETVRCAQSMRLGYDGLRRGLASAGVLVGAAACRAIDQAAATADAMQLRGDRGAAALALPSRCAAANVLVAGCGTAALVACVALAWGLPW